MSVRRPAQRDRCTLARAPQMVARLAVALIVAVAGLTGCTFDGTALEDRECDGPTNRCPTGFVCEAGYCVVSDEPDVSLDVEEDLPPDEPEVDVETDPLEGCIDDDEDGFFRDEIGCPVDPTEADCDDDNRSIYPGAPEDCNNVDEDCDGVRDNNLTPPLCAEQRGACAGAEQTCQQGEWQACGAADFQANNPAYLPDEAYCARGVDDLKGWCIGGVSNFDTPQAAEDSLCDTIDNDCDGEVDEESGVPCFMETSGTDVNDDETLVRAVNYCRAGARQCVDGMYAGGCTDQTTPIPESTPELRCNAEDNDCDGATMEDCTCDINRDNPIVDDCVCAPDSTLSCYPFDEGVAGRGECLAGIHTCGNDERYGPCEGAVGPTPESCANVGSPQDPADDDCDGIPDNIDGRVYGAVCQRDDLFGDCVPGTMRCDVLGDGGVFGCQPNIAPNSQPELCGNRTADNDCDGDTTDINVDGEDEDVHVGDDCLVPGAMGICEAGTWQCTEGSPVCTAINERMGSDAICNNLDDDCNGPVDDGVDFRQVPNCGVCGETCPLQDNICCPVEEDSLVGACFVMVDNPDHCGGCGTLSEVYRCDTDNDEMCCGTECANILTDADHCGACNSPVGGDLTCCGGVPVDTAVSTEHCGQCNRACNTETEVCCVDSGQDPNFPGCYPPGQCD